MAKINTGGSAFPRPGINERPEGCSYLEYNHAQTGMTLRDYFAAAALTGLLSRSDPRPPARPGEDLSNDPGEHYADIAYRYADAMIVERSRL